MWHATEDTEQCSAPTAESTKATELHPVCQVSRCGLPKAGQEGWSNILYDYAFDYTNYEILLILLAASRL